MSGSAAGGAKKPAKSGASTGRSRAPAGRSRARRPAKRARSGWKPTAGEQLRKALDPKRGPAGIEHVIEAAARCADRLEVLDRLHRGDVDAWIRLELARVVAEVTPERERKAFYVDCTLKIDATVGEESRQAKLLSSLLSDIYRARANLPPAPPSKQEGGDDLDLDD